MFILYTIQAPLFMQCTVTVGPWKMRFVLNMFFPMLPKNVTLPQIYHGYGISCISLIISTFAILLAPNHTLLYTFEREGTNAGFHHRVREEFRSGFQVPSCCWIIFPIPKKKLLERPKKKQENYSNMTTSWKEFSGFNKKMSIYIYTYLYFPLS